MRKDEEAAVTAAAALFEQPEADDSAVVPQEADDEAAAEQDTDEEDLFPTWEIELPDDIAADLSDATAEPTDDDVVAELERTEEYQMLDEEGQRLLARARAAEKKAEHYENLRLDEAKKGWKEEALKFFPLSAHALDEIGKTAKSHREYRRQAEAAHQAVVPYVKDVTDKAKAVIEAEKTKAVEEARSEAANAWGTVPRSPHTPTEASITQEQIKLNRSKGDLTSTVRSMIFGKKEE